MLLSKTLFPFLSLSEFSPFRAPSDLSPVLTKQQSASQMTKIAAISDNIVTSSGCFSWVR